MYYLSGLITYLTLMLLRVCSRKLKLWSHDKAWWCISILAHHQGMNYICPQYSNKLARSMLNHLQNMVPTKGTHVKSSFVKTGRINMNFVHKILLFKILYPESTSRVKILCRALYMYQQQQFFFFSPWLLSNVLHHVTWGSYQSPPWQGSQIFFFLSVHDWAKILIYLFHYLSMQLITHY